MIRVIKLESHQTSPLLILVVYKSQQQFTALKITTWTLTLSLKGHSGNLFFIGGQVRFVEPNARGKENIYLAP